MRLVHTKTCAVGILGLQAGAEFQSAVVSLTWPSRVSAAATFALAALACQFLVWMFVTIDADVPAWPVFWMQIAVMPLAGALGATCWTQQALTHREGVWRGWAVMFIFVCASAITVASVLGRSDTLTEWVTVFVASFALMVRVLGAALIFAFGVAGYFLSDDRQVQAAAPSVPAEPSISPLPPGSANDSDFGPTLATCAAEDRLDG